MSLVKFSIRMALAQALAVTVLFSPNASASGTRHSDEPIYIISEEIEDDRKRDNWAGRFSLGAQYGSSFLGSSSESFKLAVDIKANYRDLIFIENNKIGSVIYKKRLLRAGVIGRSVFGRPNRLPLINIDRSGDIGTAFEAGVFAGTSLYKFFLTAEAYFDVTGISGGASVELEGGYTFEFNSVFKFTPVFGAVWGSEKYQQTYFEGAGGRADFRAKAGIYEFFGETALEQRLSENWLIKGTARLSYLTGSAGRSPLVQGAAGSRLQVASVLAFVRLF